jgi:16S rRNA (cytosine967-C5)-methyltransferase
VKASGALAQALRDAAPIVAAVAEGKSLAALLDGALVDGLATRRAALIDLTHGTLRRYGRVQAIVEALSRRGPPQQPVEALLWCSLYALESSRYADYTVVDQAVRACGLLEQWSAKGYVNALLRAYLRERASIEARIGGNTQAHYQHPGWWIETLRTSYPAEWQQILTAGNSHPPMCLRVNRRRTNPADYLRRLAGEGLSARIVGPDAVLLDSPVPVDRLPGFRDGDASVQDGGAQRAAHCLELRSGQRVLDACAAPGGKSAHMLEAADVELTALDLDAARCRRLEQNLERLRLKADVRCADCTKTGEWWTGQPFDRILADVPCSASGVVRRHPDLKWLRRERDTGQFASRQSAILDALWHVLAPDGKLLYATCSVFADENDEVVTAFLARTPQARRLPLPDGQPPQWLPDMEHDGFYYALIEKQA